MISQSGSTHDGRLQLLSRTVASGNLFRILSTCVQHLLPRHPQRETDVSLEDGARRHHVDLHAASDGADVERHFVDDAAGAGAHGAIHRGTAGVDRGADVIGDLGFDLAELLELGRDRHRGLGRALAGMRIGAVRTGGADRDLAATVDPSRRSGR